MTWNLVRMFGAWRIGFDRKHFFVTEALMRHYWPWKKKYKEEGERLIKKVNVRWPIFIWKCHFRGYRARNSEGMDWGMKGGNGMGEKEFSTQSWRRRLWSMDRKSKLWMLNIQELTCGGEGRYWVSAQRWWAASSLFTVSCGSWKWNPVCSSRSVSNCKFCKQNTLFNPFPFPPSSL